MPQLSDIIGRVGQDLNATGVAPSVHAQYGAARRGTESDFAQVGRGQQAYIGQQFAQSGGIYNTNQIADARMNAALTLDTQRKGALRNLQFQEAESGLSQYNTLLQLLGTGSAQALGLGGAFGGAQGTAIGGLSNVSEGGAALSGGVAGAGAGSAFGPYGALLGGVLGAAGGAMSAP